MLLTARDSVEDKVAGLNEGAGDYLVKPFEMAELLARLHAWCAVRAATSRRIMSVKVLP